MRHRLIIRLRIASKTRRIIKAHMHNARTRKHRACFVCAIADCHHDIKRSRDVFRPLASVSRDIHTRLSHCANRKSIHAMRIRASRVSGDIVSLQRLRPSFSHLATTGIAGAKKENSKFFGHNYSFLLLQLPPGRTTLASTTVRSMCDTRVNRISHRPQRTSHIRISNRVENRLRALFARQHARSRQGRQVPRNHRHVHVTTVGHFAD